jgi:DNA-binding beta-propeller fold protein YncE
VATAILEATAGVVLLASGSSAVLQAEEPPRSFEYELVPVDAIWGHLVRGRFREPTGVFFEPVARELYVVDSKNGLIGIYNDEGTPLFAFGGAPLLVDPKTVAVRADGEILVLDNDQTRIKVFSY